MDSGAYQTQGLSSTNKIKWILVHIFKTMSFHSIQQSFCVVNDENFDKSRVFDIRNIENRKSWIHQISLTKTRICDFQYAILEIGYCVSEIGNIFYILK